MSTLFELLIAWGVLTAALIALLIYRGTLTMHEDDQLFLGESEAHMAREQLEIMQKVNRLGPFVKVLGTASAAMILGIAGWRCTRAGHILRASVSSLLAICRCSMPRELCTPVTAINIGLVLICSF